MIEPWRASTVHFDEEMGFQFLRPRSTVLSPSDPRPPTVTEPGELLKRSDPGIPQKAMGERIERSQ